jgi:photosystem II stability/assembly factor-like uncharacterized protein
MKKFSHCLLLLLIIPLMGFEQVPSAWSSRGIGGGGALFSPSINPANPQELYMGCDMSELFHSTDMGATWSEVSFLQLEGGHDACMQFTVNPMIRYTVDYTSVSGSDYVRPMKTTDGGNTWNIISGSPYPLEPNGGILRLIADYDHPDNLVIADYGTIYFSSDGGASFHQVHTNNSSGAGNHIAGVFFDIPNIYIGTNDGLLVSANSGSTFSVMTATGIPAGQYMLSFTGAKQNSSTRFFCLTAANVWAGYQYGSDYWNAMKGIYQMDNASGTWISNTSGITIGSDFPVFIGMAANNTGICYISGGSSSGNPIVMKSMNGGPWSHVFLTANNQNILTGWCGYGGDHGWSYAEAPFGFTVCFNDANRVMFTDYSDSHITTDGGATWQQQYLDPADQNPMNAPTPKGKNYHGVGMENTSCWDLLWTDSLSIYGGYSDINGIMSNDKGQSWKFIPGLTQNSVYRIVKDESGKIYAATSNVHDLFQSTRIYDAQIDAGTGAVYFSQDNGTSFTILHNFNHPVVWIAKDPSNPNRMYASVLHSSKGTIGGIWVTDNLNSGASSAWSKMPNPPRSNGHPYSINVLNNGDLVVSYSARKPTSSTPFTDSSGVYYYNYSTTTWYDRSHTNMRFWTMDVVVDPNDASQSTWYGCVFTGWGTSGIAGTGGLYKTSDKGISWSRINDDFRVNSCTINPSNPDELYMTTEIAGLWISQDAGSTTPAFTQVGSYPFRHPMRVFYNPYKPSELWVTSFGNGIKVAGGSGPFGIPPASKPDNLIIAVSPNPCHDFLMVFINKYKPDLQYTYTLYDITGKQICRGVLVKETLVELDGQMIPAGVYFLKVSDGESIIAIKKVIKIE